MMNHCFLLVLVSYLLCKLCPNYEDMKQCIVKENLRLCCLLLTLFMIGFALFFDWVIIWIIGRNILPSFRWDYHKSLSLSTKTTLLLSIILIASKEQTEWVVRFPTIRYSPISDFPCHPLKGFIHIDVTPCTDLLEYHIMLACQLFAFTGLNLPLRF